MPRLSAIIITLNEEAAIAACLDSVAFCDEVVVLDSGSTDQTCAIAKARGARVAHQDWLGYGPQKNAALALASGDWVLSLDADETISPALASEIRAAIENSDKAGYEMPRLSRFLGRTMRYSGWYPDYVLRLFRRNQGRFSDDLVHERVVVDGVIDRLTTPIDHMTMDSLDQAVAKTIKYAGISAERIAASPRRIRFWNGITHGLFAFLKTYGLRAGFLDGKEGFLLAVLNAQGSYHRYMKAWDLQRRNRVDGK